jgi:hypothetical protein
MCLLVIAIVIFIVIVSVVSAAARTAIDIVYTIAFWAKFVTVGYEFGAFLQVIDYAESGVRIKTR